MYIGAQNQDESHSPTKKGIIYCVPNAFRAGRGSGAVLTEERDCSEVLQVMSAARGAMNSLMAELLEGHIRSPFSTENRTDFQQVVAADEVIGMVKSYLK